MKYDDAYVEWAPNGEKVASSGPLEYRRPGVRSFGITKMVGTAAADLAVHLVI